jgi:hypothetical protein
MVTMTSKTVKEVMSEIVTLIFTEGPSDYRKISEDYVRYRLQGSPYIYMLWEKSLGVQAILEVSAHHGEVTARINWRTSEYTPDEALEAIELHQKVALLGKTILTIYGGKTYKP